MLKNNAEMVDTIFCLMFETLWLSPYDKHRGEEVFRNFELRARTSAMSLSVTDLSFVSAAKAAKILQELEALCKSIDALALSGIFPAAQCAEAVMQVGRILEIVRRKAPAAELAT